MFAPTDEALAAALDALGLTTEELLASDDLAGILTYHVVASKLMAADVLAAVESDDGNGVVHVIDAVILPPSP